MPFPATDWLDWTNLEYAVGAPATALHFERWFRNPVAIAQGAIGAPRIEDAALSTTITFTGVDWVSKRAAAAPAGYLGQQCFMSHQGETSGTYVPGDTTAGSNLKFTSGGVVSTSATSGTWMCCGYCITNNIGTTPMGSPDRKTTWMRVA